MRDALSGLFPALKRPPTVAVIRLQGAIGAGGRGLSDAALAPVIEAAFKAKPVAVALEINSPGGSAVQSSLIAGRIRRLAVEKDLPVLAFVEDVAASGGYWLACAADEIWADRTSILGSVGVIAAGFGAHEAIARIGVERRVHTAGESKSVLDPFRPEKAEDVAKLDEVLADLHAAFIDHVKLRRGTKLADDPALFTGAFWAAERAIRLGLADGIGHLVPVMQGRFGDKVQFRRFGARRSLAARFGLSLAADTLAAIEERAAYARFGL
jgi:signal peptide peptidase SppA